MRRNDDTDGLEITPAEAVVSCVRAWGHAIGNVVEFTDLPAAEQERWFSAVKLAMDWLPDQDGRPVAEGVSRIMADYAGDDAPLLASQAPYRAEWEAVVRHLNALLDTDELEDESDVSALEASWAQWVQRRRPKVEVS